MNNTQRLLSCVFQNRADEAITILRQGDFDWAILDDVGLTDVPLPLYKITSCFAIILDDDDWEKEYLPTILINRRECKKLQEFWRSEFGLASDNLDLRPYEKYPQEFQDWDFDALLDGTPEELVQKGYNLDEAMLCYGVLTNRWNIIDEQISKGTNPDVYISGDFSPKEACEDDGSSYNALNSAFDSYCDAFVCYELGWAFDRERDLTEVERRDIVWLIHAATYRQHYLRLKELDERIKNK